MINTLKEVLAYRKEMYEKSTALVRRKGADYNRDQQLSGDTLFNLRVCEVLGIVPSIEEGILVRLSDKFMRLISLTKPGREAEVSNESVEDTVADVHNYIDYLALVWKSRRRLGTALEAEVKRKFEFGGEDWNEFCEKATQADQANKGSRSSASRRRAKPSAGKATGDSSKSTANARRRK